MILEGILEKNEMFKVCSHEDALNTIQIRFSAIPLHYCVLFINKETFSDPYIYAKHLSDKYAPLAHKLPVIRIEEGIGNQFEYLKAHFNTCWSCFGTIFSGDCTHFNPDKNTGKLHEFIEPEKINWKRRANRVRKRRNKIRESKTKVTKQINIWKKFLSQNLELYTYKFSIPRGLGGTLSDNSYLKIGTLNKEYYFELGIKYTYGNDDKNTIDRIQNPIIYKKNKSLRGFKFLLHYAANKRANNANGIIQDNWGDEHYHKSRFLPQIIELINNLDENHDPNNPITIDMLFSNFGLKLNKGNISIVGADLLRRDKELKYDSIHNDEKGD